MTTKQLEDWLLMPNLSSTTRPDFIIDGYIERGTLGIISAAPNVGKTAFCFSMAKAITTGQDFHGMRIPKPTNCLFIQFDMSLAQHTRYNAMYATDCPIAMIPGRRLITDENGPHFAFFDLTDERRLAELALLCKERNIGVVFIDTLSTAFPNVDENSNNAMNKVMGSLKNLAQNDIAVVALHHVSKSEYGYSSSTRGASAIVGVADWLIGLKRNSKGLLVSEQTKTRSSSCGTQTVSLIDNTGIHEVVHESEESTDCSRVMSVFIGGVSTATRKEILDATGMGTHQVQAGLEECVKNNLLSKSKVGKADVYTLVTKENEEETA